MIRSSGPEKNAIRLRTFFPGSGIRVRLREFRLTAASTRGRKAMVWQAAASTEEGELCDGVSSRRGGPAPAGPALRPDHNYFLTGV